MKYILALLLVLLAACSPEQLTPEQQEYKDFCRDTDGMWMKMSPLLDGKVTGDPCYGCMPDEKNHLCTQAEYEAMIA